MSAIIDFFSGIADVISSVIDFIVNFSQDLVYGVKLLGSFFLNIRGYFEFFLPGAAVALFITLFGIVIVYQILGRN